MKRSEPLILAINGGSSSIRFALFKLTPVPVRVGQGKIDRIGLTDTALTFSPVTSRTVKQVTVPVVDDRSAVASLADWLTQQGLFESLTAVGHRLVHGMHHAGPVCITSSLIAELRRIGPSVPQHLSHQIELVEAFQPHVDMQVACFDTGFHHEIPAAARMWPISRADGRQGLCRYDSHGLSYAYLLEALARLKDPAAVRGRVILAHLGNAASMAAVRDGRGIDTTPGFTLTAGLPMRSRYDGPDARVIRHLARNDYRDTAQIDRRLKHESGLLGVSERSSDMRDLLSRERDDERAAEAIARFCYQVRNSIGVLARTLGGLDTLVFAGGMGENAPTIRERICADLAFMGIVLDGRRNASNAGLISATDAPVSVRVIPTDEELMIARSTARLIRRSSTQVR